MQLFFDHLRVHYLYTSQGQAGNAVQYLTRNQALKKLQLKLSEFRRLCILKGIHPREPKKKLKGANKTYYHVKDIAFMLHEPLLKKVRELAAYDKKIRKAAAKKNADLAKRLASRRPTYQLDHLIKERYPSFVDALRDLDDPLTLIHLFAVLPADSDHDIPPQRVQLSRRLALEWQAFVIKANALRKVFVSVKGYYYQAEVHGQTITWLVPHQLNQILPHDVDFKVMLTFLELHHTMLQFVLYKLYKSIGLKYPPVLDEDLDDAAVGSFAVKAIVDGVHEDEDEKKKGKINDGSLREKKEVNPVAVQRMKMLSHKVQQLEEEIRDIGKERKKNQLIQDIMENDVDEEEFDIDSGEEESSDEEENSDDDLDDGIDNKERMEDDDKAVTTTATPTSDKNKNADTVLVGGAIDVDDDDDAALCSTLFRGLTFYLGREVPREQLLLVIRSFGGVAGWDGNGSPISEDSPSITHHIMDRPKPLRIFPGRDYVQPQWVFDSTNARVLVRTALYGPGQAPPPHLSPFVDAESEGYMPEYGKEVQQLRDAARNARRKFAGQTIEEAFLTKDDVDGKVGTTEEVDAEEKHAEELARELDGVDGGEKEDVLGAKKRARTAKNNGEDDEDAMKDIMMTRKVRKMYHSVKKEQAAKRARAEGLEARAAELKKSKK